MRPVQNDKIALEAYEPISTGEVISYGLGDVGFNLYWAPITAFLMMYLTDVVGIKAASVGGLFVVMRLLSGIADPIFAAIADRTHTSYGRYRPWFLWLCVPLAAIGIVAFSTAGIPKDSQLFVVCLSMPILNIIYTAVTVPYNALSGVISPDSKQREVIMSARFGGAFLSAVFVTWLTPKLVEFSGNGDQALGWQFAMTVYGVIFILIFINLFVQTRERFSTTAQPNANPLADIRDLFRNRPWVVQFILAFVVMIAFILHTGVTPYYVKYSLGRPDLVTPFAMVFGLGLAAGSAASSILTRWFSRQLLIALMLGVVGVSGIGLYLTPPAQIALTFALQTFTGIALGTVSTLTFAMYADTADFNAWKTGKRATAMTYSMIMFSKKIGAAVAAVIVSWTLTSHYVANAAPTPDILANLRVSMGLVPAVMAFIGVGIIWLYDLTPEKVTRLQMQLLGGFYSKS